MYQSYTIIFILDVTYNEHSVRHYFKRLHIKRNSQIYSQRINTATQNELRSRGKINCKV